MVVAEFLQLREKRERREGEKLDVVPQTARDCRVGERNYLRDFITVDR